MCPCTLGISNNVSRGQLGLEFQIFAIFKMIHEVWMTQKIIDFYDYSSGQRELPFLTLIFI